LATYTNAELEHLLRSERLTVTQRLIVVKRELDALADERRAPAF
jgi:hypothetical protein